MRNVAQAKRGRMRPAVVILITSLSLATFSSNALAMGCMLQPPLVILKCPPLKAYSPAESKEIGVALGALRSKEPASILPKIIDDAFVLRQQCRALEAGK